MEINPGQTASLVLWSEHITWNKGWKLSNPPCCSLFTHSCWVNLDFVFYKILEIGFIWTRIRFRVTMSKANKREKVFKMQNKCEMIMMFTFCDGFFCDCWPVRQCRKWNWDIPCGNLPSLCSLLSVGNLTTLQGCQLLFYCNSCMNVWICLLLHEGAKQTGWEGGRLIAGTWACYAPLTAVCMFVGVSVKVGKHSLKEESEARCMQRFPLGITACSLWTGGELLSSIDSVFEGIVCWISSLHAAVEWFI